MDEGMVPGKAGTAQKRAIRMRTAVKRAAFFICFDSSTA